MALVFHRKTLLLCFLTSYCLKVFFFFVCLNNCNSLHLVNLFLSESRILLVHFKCLLNWSINLLVILTYFQRREFKIGRKKTIYFTDIITSLIAYHNCYDRLSCHSSVDGMCDIHVSEGSGENSICACALASRRCT